MGSFRTLSVGFVVGSGVGLSVEYLFRMLGGSGAGFAVGLKVG